MKNLIILFSVLLLLFSFQINSDSTSQASIDKMLSGINDQVLQIYKITHDFELEEIEHLTNQLSLNNIILMVNRNEEGKINGFTVSQEMGTVSCSMDIDTHGYVYIGRNGSLGCGLMDE